MEKTNTLKYFRIVAMLEGVSFLLLLFVAMPLKYMYQMPMPNKIIGMVHGVLFVAYVFYLMNTKAEYGWSFKKAMGGFLASILPFGTFVFDAMVLKKEVK